MNKQQILFIDGGEVSENFESYIDELKKLKIKDPFIGKKRWKYTLQKWLWDNYSIAIADTPNDFFAKYEEWEIMFKKIIPYLRDEIILIWHSLWGTFLVKYLNENNFPVKIKHILLVAPAFEDNKKELLGSFNFDKKLEKLQLYSHIITLYYSLDDFVIPVSDFENFKKILWDIECKEFRNKWHFLQENFPEIIEDIKKIKRK